MKILKNTFMILTVLGIILTVLFTTNNVYGATATNAMIQRNIDLYINGGKEVKTKVNDGKDDLQIGFKEPQGTGIAITVSNNSLELSDGSITRTFGYSLTNDTCTFNIKTTATNANNSGDFATDIEYPLVYPIFFIAVTDCYNIDSKTALDYYENKMKSNYLSLKDIDFTDMQYEKYKSIVTKELNNVNDDVFKYNVETSGDTNIFRYDLTMTINLNKLGLITGQSEQEENTTNTTNETNSTEVTNTTENSTNDNTIVINNTTNEITDNTTIKAKSLPQTGSTITMTLLAIATIVALIYLFIRIKMNKDLK